MSLTFKLLIKHPPKPMLKIFNSIKQNSTMVTKDTPLINLMKQWPLILLYSRRSRCSHRISKISRKLVLQTKTLLWANLLGPPFNRISRTISISAIIDKEGDRLQEAILNLFPLSRAIFYWITRQILAKFNTICNLISLFNHNKSSCQSRNRCKDRWSSIRIELIHHFLPKFFLLINSNRSTSAILHSNNWVI